MQRCVAFLTDELKVCGREEAQERVFFISAREVLTIRAKALNGGTPPGAAPSIGTPSSGGKPILLKCYLFISSSMSFLAIRLAIHHLKAYFYQSGCLIISCKINF